MSCPCQGKKSKRGGKKGKGKKKGAKKETREKKEKRLKKEEAKITKEREREAVKEQKERFNKGKKAGYIFNASRFQYVSQIKVVSRKGSPGLHLFISHASMVE